MAAQGNWIAGRAYLEAAYQGGCLDPVCLRWLSVTYLSLAEYQRAESVLKKWREN